ncbi:MAG: calcium-binding protein, partial [Conexibacter sp.]|nr:calcium-binding protein [Conexibacter sp.]
MGRRAAATAAGIATAAACALGLAPAVAGAATVSIDERLAFPQYGERAATEVVVAALPGEVNHITFSSVAADVVVRDPGVALTPGDGCVATAPGQVTCHGPQRAISRLVVDAGDGDDVVDASATDIELSANGGDGADTLIGGGGDDVLLGDDGDDQLTGGPGDDYLSGWTGADRTDGGEGDDRFALDGDPTRQRGDVVTCGPGADAAETPAAYEQLTDACERVTISVPGAALEPVTVRGPLRAVRGGLVLRLACNREVDGDGRGCRIRVAATIPGRRTLRGATSV